MSSPILLPTDADAQLGATASWLRTHWARVRIELVEVVRVPHGDQVRAIVHLGELTPADVRVELLADPQGGGDLRQEARPMWSRQSYDNGSFVFEASVTSPAVPTGGLVRVGARTIRSPALQRRVVARRASPGR